ncbi:MAG: carboxypeptidase regulatory-like domain-containing protein [Bacteroidota bacterium]
MRKRLISKLNMYQAVQQVLKANTSTINKLARLNTEVQNFNQLVTHITELNTSLSVGTKGITNNNTHLKTTMIQAVCKLSRGAYVWAKDQKNIPLLTLFNVSKTNFIRLADTDCYAKANAVLTPIETNARSLVDLNIKPTDVTAARQLVNTFQTKLGTTQSALKNNKSILAQISTLFKSAQASLAIITDLVVNMLNEPAFAGKLLATKVINEAAVRKTGVSIKVTDEVSNSPIPNAKIFVEGSPKTDTAHQQGICQITKMRSGHYTLRIEAAGYITQSIQATVEQGKITQLQISLNKA